MVVRVQKGQLAVTGSPGISLCWAGRTPAPQGSADSHGRVPGIPEPTSVRKWGGLLVHKFECRMFIRIPWKLPFLLKNASGKSRLSKVKQLPWGQDFSKSFIY